MCLRSSHGWCSREKLTEKFQILITSGKTTIFSGQQQSQANNFIKKETLAQVFSCEYSEMLQNIFLKEYVRWLLLVFIIRRKVFYIKRKQLFSEESAKLRALRAFCLTYSWTSRVLCLYHFSLAARTSCRTCFFGPLVSLSSGVPSLAYSNAFHVLQLLGLVVLGVFGA